MEHILHLYQKPYNPFEPLICFDERPCQLIANVVQPIPMKPRKAKRQHSTYQRNGTCCALVAFEPLQAFRFAEVYTFWFGQSNQQRSRLIGPISGVVYIYHRSGFQGENGHDQWISHKITGLGHRWTSKRENDIGLLDEIDCGVQEKYRTVTTSYYRYVCSRIAHVC